MKIKNVMYKIKIVSDFSPTPGPRYEHEGKNSGEIFRKKILFPEVSKAILENQPFTVDLDGTAGYGTSFLEEAFGGLIRINGLDYHKIIELMSIITEEEDYLLEDIMEYLKDAYGEFIK